MSVGAPLAARSRLLQLVAAARAQFRPGPSCSRRLAGLWIPSLLVLLVLVGPCAAALMHCAVRLVRPAARVARRRDRLGSTGGEGSCLGSSCSRGCRGRRRRAVLRNDRRLVVGVRAGRSVRGAALRRAPAAALAACDRRAGPPARRRRARVGRRASCDALSPKACLLLPAAHDQRVPASSRAWSRS